MRVETVIKNRYIVHYKLVDLLERLFPGRNQWRTMVRLIILSTL